MSARRGAIEVAVQLDDARIAAFLERERLWSAYALCDLDQPYRSNARFIGAERGDMLTAVLLSYAPPGFTALVPCGDAAGTAEILARTDALPHSATLISQWDHRAAFERHYDLSAITPTLRMTVSEGSLVPAAEVDARIVLLSQDDLPRMQRLYAQWPNSVFVPSMFMAGFYFGAERAGQLVAVAGSHAFSRRHAMGVVGNVFAHAAHRGSGLGSAVTAAVVAAMLASGARDVALSVRADNHPAVNSYARLGFSTHTAFFEATATLV